MYYAFSMEKIELGKKPTTFTKKKKNISRRVSNLFVKAMHFREDFGEVRLPSGSQVGRHLRPVHQQPGPGYSQVPLEMKASR
jgi:hypothetical protein